jgi:hypothetical protein
MVVDENFGRLAGDGDRRAAAFALIALRRARAPRHDGGADVLQQIPSRNHSGSWSSS